MHELYLVSPYFADDSLGDVFEFLGRFVKNA